MEQFAVDFDCSLFTFRFLLVTTDILLDFLAVWFICRFQEASTLCPWCNISCLRYEGHFLCS